MGSDRPMTQQGLGGVKARTQGPGRLIQDISFFQAELRSKTALLQQELARFATEQEAIERENANYAVFERKSQVLGEELGALQDTLGDYNTLLDKLHREEDVESIERQANSIKLRNTRDQQILDTLFAERQKWVACMLNAYIHVT
jgi:intraflagellar transport protein 74